MKHLLMVQNTCMVIGHTPTVSHTNLQSSMGRVNSKILQTLLTHSYEINHLII